MLGYFYLKTHSLLGAIIWHGLWNAVISNLSFDFVHSNYIGWESGVIVNLLIDIATFFIIMVIMVRVFNYHKKGDLIPVEDVEMQQVEEIKVVEVEEIPIVPRVD